MEFELVLDVGEEAEGEEGRAPSPPMFVGEGGGGVEGDAVVSTTESWCIEWP